MKNKTYMAVDLGASSGRCILGSFDGRKLKIDELNRFENHYVRTGDAYFWDVLRLYSGIVEGLKRIGISDNNELSGIAVDTWGVDFGLIDRQGRLIGNPRAYRDPRALRGMKAFQEKFGQRTAFDLTGIANQEYNTLYQLYDMVNSKDPMMEIADKMLLMPDLLTYMLCGRVSCEFTHATTTQILSTSGGWSKEIIEMLGINELLFPDIQMSGEKKANLTERIASTAGLKGTVPVFCVGAHDTASAVASVPATTENYAFLSSGTWSVFGIETANAVVNDTVYKNGFSNEGAVTGNKRLIQNIMGLWIIQNCKRQWDSVSKTGWNEIVAQAKEAKPFASFIDVKAHEFFAGENMVEKIQTYCKETSQYVPQTKGEIARTVFESLAMCYKEAFDELEQIKGSSIDVLHIIGGGANNKLLNQMTANAINRPVTAGPIEATAIGNLMMQVKASGEVKDFGEMRQVIRDSFDVETYEPKDTDEWSAQLDRFIKIKESKSDN